MKQNLLDIKHLRKRFNLNQKALADKAGVSQSLIAKIEAGKIDPSFSKTQQIFAALEQLQNKEEIKAERLMSSKVVCAEVNNTINEIIKVLKNKGISQVPVFSQNQVCGLITESTILEAATKYPAQLQVMKVSEIMEDAPPIVSPQTGVRTLQELLKYNPIILVAEKGRIKGIISKTDVLGKSE